MWHSTNIPGTLRATAGPDGQMQVSEAGTYATNGDDVTAQTGGLQRAAFRPMTENEAQAAYMEDDEQAPAYATPHQYQADMDRRGEHGGGRLYETDPVYRGWVNARLAKSHWGW